MSYINCIGYVNYMSILLITRIVLFKSFKNFLWIIRVKDPNYKNKNIEIEHLSNLVKKKFFKVRNSLLESEKYFTELKEKDLKDRELKIKREINCF